MADEWLALVESNTTGTGRLFCSSARQMGLRPVLMSRDPGRYPYVESDAVESVLVDTCDIDAVRTACAGLGGRIAGVTSSSEYFVAKAAAVARSLGLPHPVPEAIATAQNKNALRMRLRDAGLPVPDFGTATTPDAAVDISKRIGFPVVVKPVVGSGSIGVRLCSDAIEVKTASTDVLDAEPPPPNSPSPPAVLVEDTSTAPNTRLRPSTTTSWASPQSASGLNPTSWRPAMTSQPPYPPATGRPSVTPWTPPCEHWASAGVRHTLRCVLPRPGRASWRSTHGWRVE